MFEFIKRKNHKATESIAVRKLWNYTSSNRSKITELCTYTNWINDYIIQNEEELKEMRKDLNEARIQIEHVETIVEERK